MKVLVILHSKNPITGPYIATLNMILGLLKNGIQVYVIGPDNLEKQKIFYDEIRKNNGKVFYISSKKSGIKYWKSLGQKTIEVTNEFDINITHLPIKLVHFVGKKLRSQNKKIVLTLHGDPIMEANKMKFITKIQTKYLWKETTRFSDVICPVSFWLSNNMKEKYNTKNLIPVHNSIDFKFLGKTQNIRNNLNLKKEDFVVTSLSRLAKEKAVDIIIKGFAKFLQKNPVNAKLLIIGQGPEKENLIKLTKELSIQRNVLFLGFVIDPQDYVASSNIFVMASNYEPFGMPILEASALGIPVICSKTGGLTEILVENKTGFSFTPNNSEELSLKIEQLYKDKNLRKILGQNAKKHAIENFSPEVIAKKFIEIYSNLLN